MEIRKKSKPFLHQEMPIFPEELQSFYSPVPNKCTRCTASIKTAGSKRVNGVVLGLQRRDSWDIWCYVKDEDQERLFSLAFGAGQHP